MGRAMHWLRLGTPNHSSYKITKDKVKLLHGLKGLTEWFSSSVI